MNSITAEIVFHAVSFLCTILLVTLYFGLITKQLAGLEYKIQQNQIEIINTIKEK